MAKDENKALLNKQLKKNQHYPTVFQKIGRTLEETDTSIR